MHKNHAKIVSLVPSWTETLLEAGLDVIGRTRFCIHPADKVVNIPIVGGTKNIKLDEILALQPDFVVMDKEENTKETAEQLEEKGVKLIVSHVGDFDSAAKFLADLSFLFNSSELFEMSKFYGAVSRLKFNQLLFLKNAVLESNKSLTFENCEYVIWKSPFMVVGSNTFIAENLGLFGIKLTHAEKYPVISENNLKKRYSLFSTEPYPFLKEFKNLTLNGFNGAVVDGEKISWYGARNIKFLKSCLV